MTRVLLDTNILSETRKPRVNAGLESFMARQKTSDVFISVLTLGELRKGAENKRFKDPPGATKIEFWIDGIETAFADRILAVDIVVARRWGTLSAGRTRPVVDTLIAATALAHGLTLVTRNTIDFRDLDISLINPFTTPAA